MTCMAQQVAKIKLTKLLSKNHLTALEKNQLTLTMSPLRALRESSTSSSADSNSKISFVLAHLPCIRIKAVEDDIRG